MYDTQQFESDFFIIFKKICSQFLFLVSANGGYCRQATVPNSVDTEQYTVVWRDTDGDRSCLTRMRLIDKKTGEASAAQGCKGNIISIINSVECSSEQCIQVNCIKSSNTNNPGPAKRLVSQTLNRASLKEPFSAILAYFQIMRHEFCVFWAHHYLSYHFGNL